MPCLQGTAVLSGIYSRAVGESAHSRLRRSGFAGMTSKPLEDPSRLDLEDFDALVFRRAHALPSWCHS